MTKKDKTHEIGYDDLMDRGLKLISEAHNIIEKYTDKYKDEKVIYKKGICFDIVVMEYHKWVNDTKQFFETSFRNKVEASFFGVIDSVPSFDWLNDNWYLDVDFISKGTPFNIIKEVNKKLERIRNIYNKENKNKKIILQIKKERFEIIKKDSGFSYSFRKIEGNNKRFKYLIKIKEKPQISAKDLMEHSDTKTMQNLSKEISKLNEIIKKKLNIEDQLILNKNNTGYEINEKYEIEFIK